MSGIPRSRYTASRVGMSARVRGLVDVRAGALGPAVHDLVADLPHRAGVAEARPPRPVHPGDDRGEILLEGWRPGQALRTEPC